VTNNQKNFFESFKELCKEHGVTSLSMDGFRIWFEDQEEGQNFTIKFLDFEHPVDDPIQVWESKVKENRF
jgi:hypothetical protein